MQVTTIGLDIAKNVFQVHGVDGRGRVVLRQRLARAKVLAFFANLPRCLVGLEACGGAHHWARELRALGHDARLMPPQYVKAYVKTNKHDAADAEAAAKPCCGRACASCRSRASTAGDVMLHRVRDQLIGQRTATINALRGHLAELGIIAAQRQAGARSRRGSARSRTPHSALARRCCNPGAPSPRARDQGRRARPAAGRDGATDRCAASLGRCRASAR